VIEPLRGPEGKSGLAATLKSTGSLPVGHKPKNGDSMNARGLRPGEQKRLILFASLIILPFVIGWVASQFTGRTSRLFSGPILFSEMVFYLVYELVDDLKCGRVTAERYGHRKTYTRSRTPLGYWLVIAFYVAALAMFAWFDWRFLVRLFAAFS
jgi:hypothetical protein